MWHFMAKNYGRIVVQKEEDIELERLLTSEERLLISFDRLLISLDRLLILLDILVTSE